METIGDAYCVAAGLHRVSNYHALQIAWMALHMMDTCTSHVTHDGKPIMVEYCLPMMLLSSSFALMNKY